MTEIPELHTRLLEDAHRYDPAAHTRSLLLPYREVILLQRAKFMSYDQIAATFTRHGIKVSSPGVGAFCRRQFSKAEILRARRTLPLSTKPAATLPGLVLPPASLAPASGASAPGPASPAPGKRGPKIARDNY